MIRKLLACLLLICMCVTTMPVFAEEEIVEPADRFTDVPAGHVAYEAVEYLAASDVINGKTETEFYPDDNLKREEFAKIAANVFALTDVKDAPTYLDVYAGAWFVPFVQSVSKAGLMTGISNTEFGVGYTLTRQDLAVILKRFLDQSGATLEIKESVKYADDADISDYAREAVDFMISTGLMAPRGNNCWEPLSDATRAEAAMALYVSAVKQKEYADSLGKNGTWEQYRGPFEVPTDPLQSFKPVPYTEREQEKAAIYYSTIDKVHIGEDRFIPGDLSSGMSISETGGYGDDGACIKVVPSGKVETYRISWNASVDELAPGDYLVQTAMVKNVGLTGSGGPRVILSVYDEKGKWLNETHKGKVTAPTTDGWEVSQEILEIPSVLNATVQPKMHRISGGIYIQKDITGGTIYFDDIKIETIKMDPMSVVLMKPSYKGIIKGEGGKGDIALRVYVDHLNGTWDLSQMAIDVAIFDDDRKVYMSNRTETVKAECDFYFSSADLPMGGDYWVETTLSYKESGETIQKIQYGLHKREADFETAIFYDEYNRVLKNGEPYIPIMPYGYNTSPYTIIDAANVVANSNVDGLNWNGTYALWRYGEGVDDSPEGWKILRNAGKDMILAIQTAQWSALGSPYTTHATSQDDLRTILQKFATNFTDDPNVFGWYIFDEKEGTKYGPELSWNRLIMERYDLNHPTISAITHPMFNRRGMYAPTTDFIGYDPYPVTGLDTQNIAQVADEMRNARRVHPFRPVALVPQMFYYDSRGDGATRGPNQEEYRNMLMQALCEGACMFAPWSISWIFNKPQPGYTFEETWAYLDEVHKEVKYFEPILMSIDPAPYYDVKGSGEWLNHTARQYNGKSYLFTVNNTMDPQACKIYLDGVSKITGMYTGVVYEADDNGWFDISWDKYEVEVFEFEKADFKSPHAKLDLFSLSDVVMLDSETDAPVFVIPSDMTTTGYKVLYSDFAKLYINGQEVEAIGDLNLEGLEEIVVKVVSEDERFTTEKTYKIQRS